MITNEQRAHDIAVAMLPIMFQNEVNKCVSGASEKIDIAAIYDKLFFNCLEHFNGNN